MVDNYYNKKCTQVFSYCYWHSVYLLMFYYVFEHTMFFLLVILLVLSFYNAIFRLNLKSFVNITGNNLHTST